MDDSAVRQSDEAERSELSLNPGDRREIRAPGSSIERKADRVHGGRVVPEINGMGLSSGEREG